MLVLEILFYGDVSISFICQLIRTSFNDSLYMYMQQSKVFLNKNENILLFKFRSEMTILPCQNNEIKELNLKRIYIDVTETGLRIL